MQIKQYPAGPSVVSIVGPGPGPGVWVLDQSANKENQGEDGGEEEEEHCIAPWHI